MKRVFLQFIYLILSFCIVASAQPDWSARSCVLASCLGYALFWKGMLIEQSRKRRFFLSFIWFAAIESIHLNWLLSDRYVGVFIYPLLFVLASGCALQFALISLLIRDSEKMSWSDILGISGGWTLLEWSRLFIMTGFSWNPIGLQLTGTDAGMQFVALFGVYGLSFWIIFTNLVALKRNFLQWAAVMAIPYLFGAAHINFHSARMAQNPQPPLKALLVQTSLIPEERVAVNGSLPLHPQRQWERILGLLAPYLEGSIDLIVLPEGVLPFGDFPIYSQGMPFYSFKAFFSDVHFLPAVEQPRVGNHFWTQGLANLSQADVIVGLDAIEEGKGAAYNAAFIFHPYSSLSHRYEKRVLIPMGEYIPFQWCKKILSKYGITDSFTAGASAKVFEAGTAKTGLCICLEETYGHMMRENRLLGAELLVNLTNDVWYPKSRLPAVHFMHGRLRAIEEGIPMLRACNTGVTCGIDSLGRIVSQLPYETRWRSSQPGVLSIKLPRYHYKTIYTLFGDSLIISTSIALFALALIRPVHNLITLFFYLKKGHLFKKF